MYSLRPHRQFDFVRLWKPGFILSSCLIVLAIAGFIASFVTTGSPLTLGTEFSGGTSIQIYNTGDITESEISEAYETAAEDLELDSTVSSVQTATDTDGNPGFIIKTTDTESTNVSSIMASVEESLEIDDSNAQIETIGASWGSTVIMRSIIAFLLSCVAILIVIAIRYAEPRMGVVALITLFHDIIIILGVYAWAGMLGGMEITSDVIAALLAIVGYSLYDTVVVFHRINKNASPQMKCNLKTCANRSVNEIIVRSLNTSITSILPVLFMVILGTDTLLNFAFAMLCGMVIGVYSTIAISAPLYTLWKGRRPEYKRLEKKYSYQVVQSTFTTELLHAARKDVRAQRKQLRAQAKLESAEAKREKAEQAKAAKQEKRTAATTTQEHAAADDADDSAEGSDDGPSEEAPAASEAPQDAQADAQEAPEHDADADAPDAERDPES